MRIVFLEATTQDIQWFRYYYRSVFPEDSAKAHAHLRRFAFYLTHQRKAKRAQRSVVALHFAGICDSGFPRNALKAIQKMLAGNPYTSQPSDARENLHDLLIPRTPFTLIYRVASTQIEILRLWDTWQGTVY